MVLSGQVKLSLRSWRSASARCRARHGDPGSSCRSLSAAGNHGPTVSGSTGQPDCPMVSGPLGAQWAREASCLESGPASESAWQL